MRTIKFLLVILFGVAVTACGGGGGYGAGSSGGGSAGIYTISGTISGGTANPSHSGVTVTLSGTASQTMTTLAGGAYTFTGLANGSYTVTPTMMGGGTFTPASAPVTVYNDYPTANFTESP